eukprot:4582196-Lingulodinium_polyedra.AAC.1
MPCTTRCALRAVCRAALRAVRGAPRAPHHARRVVCHAPCGACHTPCVGRRVRRTVRRALCAVQFAP